MNTHGQRDHAVERYKLRLFITGSTPRSTRAIQNMRQICDENLKGRYDLEVIDVTMPRRQRGTCRSSPLPPW